MTRELAERGVLDLQPLVRDARTLIDSEVRLHRGITQAHRFGVMTTDTLERRSRARVRLDALDQDSPYWDFEDVEVLPPGLLDPRVWDQDRVWIDQFRELHVIGERGSLNDDHLVRVWNYLDHGRVPDLMWGSWGSRYAAIYPGWREPPGWPVETPLWRRIVGEMERRRL